MFICVHLWLIKKLLKKVDYLVGAVIIGGDFQSLGIVRSLTEKGIPVFIIECEKSISRYSRYVNRVEKNYALLSSSSFAEYLISLAQRENLKGCVC